jgi:glycerophosphoryl diester phosphodiesterase
MHYSCDIWAHRGGAYEAPENTIIAMRKSISIGVDGLEMDARLSRDNIPVIIHDATVDRTTNGHGEVASMTVRELKELDAGFWYKKNNHYPYRGKGITIPTLEEVLTSFPQTRINIELKNHSLNLPQQIQKILDDLRYKGSLLLASSSQKQLTYIRKHSSKNTMTAASIPESIKWLITGADRNFDAVELPHRWKAVESRFISLLISRRAQDSETECIIWTVNTRNDIIFWMKSGVDGIITDRPTLALATKTKVFNLR